MKSLKIQFHLMCIIQDLMMPTMQLDIFCTNSDNLFLFIIPVLILKVSEQKEKEAFL